MENRFPEPIVNSPVPQFMEVAVENCVGEQIVDSVPRVMEALAGVVRATPQERVQNRPRKLFVDVPVPHFMEQTAGKVKRTGEVFTVLHHGDDQACSDNVGFIKGLDKHNMPRLGDVMVPPLQIIKGFLGHVAADVPHRFQTKRSGRSSRAKLNR